MARTIDVVRLIGLALPDLATVSLEVSMSKKRAQSPNPGAERSGEVAADAPLALPTGKLLGRTEAARAIGVSKTTFRRRFEGTVLKPEVGTDGVHRFREERVRELVIQRSATTESPDAYDGTMAAEVFSLLDDGVHPVNVVKRLALDPRAVEAIHRQWASMRDTFVVTGSEAREIESLPWVAGRRPILDGRQLVESLSDADPRLCAKCQDEHAALCIKCASAMSGGEAKRRSAEAREQDNERERQRRKGQWEREFLPRLGEQRGTGKP
jgi:hypothetical protein